MSPRNLKWVASALLALILAVGVAWFQYLRPIPDFGRKVLLFSKTDGYRHASIAPGIDALTALGRKHRFNVVASEDATLFSKESLNAYQAVIFLNTTGDVLDGEQQYAFQRYIQAGGGFVGIHAAADTEWEKNEWPWFTRLVGGAFKSHPAIQTADITVVNKGHTATATLPAQWSSSDEWYDFQRVNSGTNTLLTISETTYKDGRKGGDHPIAWYHDYDGGRAFYTGLGHSADTYSDNNFLQHLAGGISYAMGSDVSLDYSIAIPEFWRFNRVVLESSLDEPVAMAFTPAGDLIYIERKGAIKRFDFNTGRAVKIGQLDVYTGGEQGLLGIAFDPGYADNHWVYLFYAIEDDDAVVNRLSRFNLEGDTLDIKDGITVLQFPVERGDVPHTGGSMQFDDEGQLWLSTGDNTIPHESDGYSPADDRANRTRFDAGRSAGNTQDLRGKILHIIPQKNGSYTIPDGNLFSDAIDGRLEIFAMGLRNPYKIYFDNLTNTLYWGEVGPDAKDDNSTRGPRGYDEFNRTTVSGNFGWPFVIGDNEPYAYFDFASNESSGELVNLAAPENRSSNNTGSKILPPAQPAWIHYPYSVSDEFIELGAGGRSGMTGGIYRSGDYPENPKKLPAYYDEKLFIFDWMRRWVKVVSQDQQGNITKIEPFMADNSFSAPIDLRFAPDGSLYVLEYGSAWFSQNDDAYLSRLEYYDGDNPPPVAIAKTDRKVGALPFTAKLNGGESFDRNGPTEQLAFSWDLLNNGKVGRHIANTREAEFTADVAGEYQLQLTVTDSGGASNSNGVVLVAGNEPPEVTVDFGGGNGSFYWPDTPLEYAVSVTDREDGSTENDSIPASRVAHSFEYLAEGMDMASVEMGHQDSAANAQDGLSLIEKSDCMACHTAENESVGPSFSAIAARYNLPDDLPALTNKVLNGGAGAWGVRVMSPHPQLSRGAVELMVRYIVDPNAAADDSGLTTEGVLAFQQHLGNFRDLGMAGKLNAGQYLFDVSYNDKGANNVPALTTRQTYRLRHPLVLATDFDELENVLVIQVDQLDSQIVIMRSGETLKNRSFARLNQVDLTAIEMLRVGVTTSKLFTIGGELTLRLSSMGSEPIASATIENKNIGIPSSLTYYNLPVASISGAHDIFLASETLAATGKLSPNFIILTVEFVRSE